MLFEATVVQDAVVHAARAEWKLRERRHQYAVRRAQLTGGPESYRNIPFSVVKDQYAAVTEARKALVDYVLADASRETREKAVNLAHRIAAGEAKATKRELAREIKAVLA
jgi:hypothetical protein